MNQNNQQGGQGGAVRQPPATIIAQPRPQPEPEIALIDIQAALLQARLRRRRGLWRAAQMYLSPHSEAPQDLPVPERLALARVNLINELLARANRDPESDAASSAITDRVDNTGTLIPGIDNAIPRQVQDPMLIRPYRYVLFVNSPEFARALQRHRVGTERNTGVSEARNYLLATQVRTVQNEIDNWRNNQDIDLGEMEGVEYISDDEIGDDDDDDDDDDNHGDGGERDDEDEEGDLDFCPELGSGPPEPNQG